MKKISQKRKLNNGIRNMKLREELQNITNGGAGTLREQIQKINALKASSDHTIKFFDYPDKSNPCNCFSWALDMINSELVNSILKEDALNNYRYGIKFGSDFISQLINKNILREKIFDDGKVIIYFSNNKPVHAGKIFNNRVKSKWGTDCFWEHKIWEVPLMYGDNYKTYNIPNQRLIEDQFRIHYSNIVNNIL